MSRWLPSTLQAFPMLFVKSLDILVQQAQNFPSRLKRPPKEGNFAHSSIALIFNCLAATFQLTHIRQKMRNCHLIPLPWRGCR